MELQYKHLTAEGLSGVDLLKAHKLRRSGAAIPALFHIFTEQPVYRNSALAKAFPEASTAASALIELKNYRRM